MIAAAPPRATAVGRWSVLVALARFEARRMVRHPVVWLGAAVAVVVQYTELVEFAPVLDRLSVLTSWWLLPLAAIAVWFGGDAGLRGRGHGDGDPLQVSAVGSEWRVVGTLFGLLGVVGVGLVAHAVVIGWALARGAVTAPIIGEVAAGLLTVWLFGAAGVAAARWFPHPAVPLMVALVPVGLLFIGGEDYFYQSGWEPVLGFEWWFPVVDIGPEPYLMLFRPAALHAVYLIGLLVALAGVALARSRLLWAALTVAGMAVVTVAGPAQMGEVPEARRVQTLAALIGDDAELTCETHDGVRHCVLPGYRGWINRWAEAVAPVIAAGPAGAVDGIEFRQYPLYFGYVLADGSEMNGPWWWDHAVADAMTRPDLVTTGTVWGWDGRVQAYHLAGRAVGCPLDCPGESQGVVRLWLALHHPKTRDDLQRTMERSPPSLSECIAVDLWDDPAATAAIHANWDLLTDPATTFGSLETVLGVDVPDGADEFGRVAGGCP